MVSDRVINSLKAWNREALAKEPGYPEVNSFYEHRDWYVGAPVRVEHLHDDLPPVEIVLGYEAYG